MEKLEIGGAGLTAIPPEIGNLTELCSLSLFNNHLENLPRTLTHAEELFKDSPCGESNLTVGLNLTGNPLSDIPVNVSRHNHDELGAYLHNPLWWHFRQNIVLISSSGAAVVCVITFMIGLQRRLQRRRIGKQKK